MGYPDDHIEFTREDNGKVRGVLTTEGRGDKLVVKVTAEQDLLNGWNIYADGQDLDEAAWSKQMVCGGCRLDDSSLKCTPMMELLVDGVLSGNTARDCNYRKTAEPATTQGTSSGQGGTQQGGTGGMATGSGGSGGGGQTLGSGGSGTSTTQGTSSTSSGVVTDGLGVGEYCYDEPCRTGLLCQDDYCELGHSSREGAPCIASGECDSQLICLAQVCAPAGSGGPDSACSDDQDCQQGLRCALSGFTPSCQPEGNRDLGGNCQSASDCLGGLTCQQGSCAPVAPGQPPFQGDAYAGVDCEVPNDIGVRAYFEMPGAEDAEEADFFRLPFPNDVHLEGGFPDLSGFPTPGPTLDGQDPMQIYLEAVTEQQGWSANSVVLFRFSGTIDLTTLTSEAATVEGRVRLVDITPGFGSGERDPSEAVEVSYSTGRSNYVCHNWLGVGRPLGFPLLGGHTYAAIITRDARASSGDVISPAENLLALLSDNAPSDSALSAAYAAYEPLRDYLATANGSSAGTLDIDASDVLNAAVFTVGDPPTLMDDLAQAVDDEEVPQASDWVLCDGAGESPCPGASATDCEGGAADYDEYHAVVQLPIYQDGAPPYLLEGGGVDGNLQRYENVCLALTLPKDVPPSAGWPLVIYAHGIDGSFRSHVRDEVAGALASASEPMAVLGIDQVQHGTRRGDSQLAPHRLLYNFSNPAALRGNFLQGATDLLSLLRFAQSLDVDSSDTGGDSITIDPARIYLLAHSQGATHASLMLPYADVDGAVLSGNGGSWRHALLQRSEPVNFAAALPTVLQDADTTGALKMGSWHPALGVMQQYLDVVDPLNFAATTTVSPRSGAVGHHLFLTYGLDDSYAPPATSFAYALAARAAMLRPPSGTSIDEANSNPRLPPEPGPISGNRTVDGRDITVVMRQYQPVSGSDGHFVLFDVPQANQDALNFLLDLAEGNVPWVEE